MKIDSGYKLKNGAILAYEIYDNGFDIFIGIESASSFMHQPEPYIPNPDISYEENAINMCKEISENSINAPDPPFELTESTYTSLRSDIDYLMLLSDSTDE